MFYLLVKASQNLFFFNINSFIPLRSGELSSGFVSYAHILPDCCYVALCLFSLGSCDLHSSFSSCSITTYFTTVAPVSCIFPLLCFIFSHWFHASYPHTNGDSISSDPTSLLGNDADIWYHRCFLFLSPGKL